MGLERSHYCSFFTANRKLEIRFSPEYKPTVSLEGSGPRTDRDGIRVFGGSGIRHVRVCVFNLIFTQQSLDQSCSQVSCFLPPSTRLHFYRAEG